jgi:hypothetical protein
MYHLAEPPVMSEQPLVLYGRMVDHTLAILLLSTTH